ncbi:MAG: hypothetical protein K9G62_04225 [Alphaproteobacteria bacterium]|nr:hypothetical protein [Alphaproteobacteria bacterium]
MPEHIKMPAVTPIVRYAASGAQTAFAYPFPVFASEDLAVYLGGAKQIAGFDIDGAGETGGGTVTFDTAPAAGIIVTLAREIPIERMSDYLEGGEFSAASINNELDYMIAALQQVERANDAMLHYGDHETPAVTQLPDRAARANKALGFDGDGDPVAVSLEGSMAAPDFTPLGTGAATRTSHDKFSDLISVKDFGAVGDGLADDTVAIQNALAAADFVLIPNGTYLISNTINLASGKTLSGLGQGSVIAAQDDSFNAVEITANNALLSDLRITGGDAGVKLYGSAAECTQNSLRGLQIVGARTGILLDGHNDGSKPCYWNNFSDILIEGPLENGVHLTLTGAGDTPNANRFHRVRVYSKGAATAGQGFYVEHGSFNNAFVDCESNVNGTTAQACFRLGEGSNKTLIANLLCESWNTVPNVRIDSGALETSIINLSAESDGAAIYDFSGGNYDAYNAGYPEKNRLRKSVVTDLRATLMRYDTEFIDTPGTTSIDLSHSIHIVNATGGAITIELPAAADAVGALITVKKADDTGNIITISEDSGPGPDGKPFPLGGPNDYATMISNGAEWFVIASNRMAGNTRFIDGSGSVDIDMAVDTYLLSSFGGAMTARLPPADAAEAVGRTVTLKKTDVSGNAVTVTEQGGSGPDGSSQSLAGQHDAITVVSNGANWFVTGKYT